MSFSSELYKYCDAVRRYRIWQEAHVAIAVGELAREETVVLDNGADRVAADQGRVIAQHRRHQQIH